MNQRYAFEGISVAVLGLGVSGLSASRVLKKLGAHPVVFDQKPSDAPEVVHITDQLYQEDIPVVSGWHGRIDASKYDCMVVSPGFRRNHPAVLDFSGKPVMSEVELSYRIAEAPIIGITGTNGKSTTTVLTWLLVNANGAVGHLCGNIAGSGFPERPLSTAALDARPEEFLVAEISSYQLEFASLLRPRVATILNVTPDHMDRHPSFDDYYATKVRLVENMAAGDSLVINADEPSVSILKFRNALKNGTRIISYSPTGTGVTQNESSRRVSEALYLGDTKVMIPDLGLKGEHDIANLMAAWELSTAATGSGCDPIRALEGFNGLEHRLERVGVRNGVTFINNSMCTNPSAFISSSNAVGGQQWILMGGNTKRLDLSVIRRFLTSKPHQVLLFGPSSDKLSQEIGSDVIAFASMQDAFLYAVSKAAPGETVILNPGCASEEPFVNFRERGSYFKQIAKEWINEG